MCLSGQVLPPPQVDPLGEGLVCFFHNGVQVSPRSEELRRDREVERWGSTKVEDE